MFLTQWALTFTRSIYLSLSSFFLTQPGVLSGEKQRIGRSYDFSELVSYFAERADMIILLFDAHKVAS